MNNANYNDWINKVNTGVITDGCDVGLVDSEACNNFKWLSGFTNGYYSENENLRVNWDSSEYLKIFGEDLDKRIEDRLDAMRFTQGMKDKVEKRLYIDKVNECKAGYFRKFPEAVKYISVYCVTSKQKEIGYTKTPFWVAMQFEVLIDKDDNIVSIFVEHTAGTDRWSTSLAKINKIHRYFGSGKYFFKKDIDSETLKFL